MHQEQQLHLFADRTSSATMRAISYACGSPSLAYVISTSSALSGSRNQNGRSNVPEIS